MLIGNNYNQYLNQLVIKNCDVVLRKPADNSLLLNGDNILSFSLTRENLGVLEKIPMDSLTITIKGWNTISQTIKDYLMTNGNGIFLGYVIENVETSTYIYLVIDKCEVNYKGYEAVLVCCSQFMKMGKSNFPLSALVGLSTPVPFNIGIAEIYQHYAISKARGIKMLYNTPIDNCLIDLERLTVDGNVTSQNIFDISTEEDKDDRSNIVACGIETQEEKLLGAKADTRDTHFVFYFDREYVITRVTYFYKPSASSSYTAGTGLTIRTTDFVNCNWVSPTSSSYYYAYNVYGYEANIKYTDDDKIIRAEMLKDTQTTELATLQSVCRSYYSHKTYYKVTGRINPCIEPQDNIYVDDIGIIRVEEVQLTYNGGFKGHIKGRFLVFGEVLAPVLNEVWYHFEQGRFVFGINITNPNDFPVRFYMYASQDDVLLATLQAHQTLTIDESNQDMYINFEASFYEKEGGYLEDNVMGWFETDFGESDEIEILEADY